MMSDMANFLLGFGFNFVVALLVVRFIYYPSTHNKSYVFTFLAFNTVIYLMLRFMASIELGVGVGFGLFAIFSILRYRTDPIPIREMTYLFIISALALMNSAASESGLWLQLVLANLAIFGIMLVLEKEWGFHYEASKQIIYEKIELIRPDRRVELLADLQERTGLVIKRVIVGKVDFLHDITSLKVIYDDPTQGEWLNDPDPARLDVSKDVAIEF
ncbi:MAG: DUF4956 domain-containing protein [Anaerolineaceae bacterium]